MRFLCLRACEILSVLPCTPGGRLGRQASDDAGDNRPPLPAPLSPRPSTPTGAHKTARACARGWGPPTGRTGPGRTPTPQTPSERLSISQGGTQRLAARHSGRLLVAGSAPVSGRRVPEADAAVTTRGGKLTAPRCQRLIPPGGLCEGTRPLRWENGPGKRARNGPNNGPEQCFQKACTGRRAGGREANYGSARSHPLGRPLRHGHGTPLM